MTSTTPTENYFVDEASEMSSSLYLRNCTLYQRFSIGLVEQADNGSTEGYSTLVSIFDDLNEAYSKANTADGFSLNVRKFKTDSELDDHVKESAYHNDAVCFALSWDEFDVEEKTFSLNLRWNYGDILPTRKP